MSMKLALKSLQYVKGGESIKVQNKTIRKKTKKKKNINETEESASERFQRNVEYLCRESERKETVTDEKKMLFDYLTKKARRFETISKSKDKSDFDDSDFDFTGERDSVEEDEEGENKKREPRYERKR